MDSSQGLGHPKRARLIKERRMVMVRYGLVAALLALLSLSSSCLTVADDEGPILSVELYWDEEADSGFEGGTCESAGVDEMEWTLLDENGDEVQTSLSGD